MQYTFYIDFDSTFVSVESLDLLAEIVFATDPQRDTRVASLAAITTQGMDGTIDYQESLRRRLEVLQPHRSQIEVLIDRLRSLVSTSFESHADFLRTHASQIYIISGGFHEFIDPIVARYGITPDHVFANTLTFSSDGAYAGYDAQSPLASGSDGKIQIIRTLGIDPARAIMIGDGSTDARVKHADLVWRFYAYTEHVERPSVITAADRVVKSFDEVLADLDIPRFSRYPKSKIKVLLLENIHPNAVALFEKEGYQIETMKKSLNEKDLKEKIKSIHILGIRSKTQVTKAVLQSAAHLHAIGAFCIGTNQIDLSAAATRGTAIFNAPFSNTRSVVELTISQIIALKRRLTEKNEQMHGGRWDKSAEGCHEIRGKVLGIVGYGNIGTQLSIVAEALGMQVIYYDIAQKLTLGNARKALSLDELLKCADVVTLHVDGRSTNTHLIAERELHLMKKGACLINASRGHVVDLSALRSSLKSGHLSGAAIDVFPEEPLENGTFTTSLQGIPNVILTPHIAGSTVEAQSQIGTFVAERIIEYINTGSTTLSVSLPAIQLTAQGAVHRIIHIHENVPGVLASLNEVFGHARVNIEAQYLKTNEQVGYVITDVNRVVDQELITKLKHIPGTIRVRVLY
jgi:D-3-phosphoglycerate dehydrogenase